METAEQTVGRRQTPAQESSSTARELKLGLMQIVREWIDGHYARDSEAARAAGVHHCVISRIVHEDVGRISIDGVLDVADRFGIEIKIRLDPVAPQVREARETGTSVRTAQSGEES